MPDKPCLLEVIGDMEAIIADPASDEDDRAMAQATLDEAWAAMEGKPVEVMDVADWRPEDEAVTSPDEAPPPSEDE